MALDHPRPPQRLSWKSRLEEPSFPKESDHIWRQCCKHPRGQHQGVRVSHTNLPLPPHNTGFQPEVPSTVPVCNRFSLVLNGQKCVLPGQANPQEELDASRAAAIPEQGSKASPFSALGFG